MQEEAVLSEAPYDEDGHVLVRKQGAIAQVVLNRPDRLNAFTMHTEDAVRRAFLDLSEDDAIKVVIFRGVGRAFSTGGDVAWLGEQYFSGNSEDGAPRRRPSQRRRLNRDQQSGRTFEAILNCNKVVIAEGKGYVLGVALDWFLAADILVCSEGTVLGHPPARMIGATGGSTAYWMLRMGPAMHAEVCLMGRYIQAEEAQSRGLVNRVVAPENLEDTVMAAAEAVCLLPADGLAIGKYNRRVAYDLLGVHTSHLQGMMGHAMQVQQRMEPGEWHLVKEREQHGVKGAFRRRDERFKEIFLRFNPNAPV